MAKSKKTRKTKAKRSKKKTKKSKKKQESKNESKITDDSQKEKEEIGPQQPPVHEMLKEMLGEEDAKAVEAYAGAVLKKFGRYIKSVALWGSKKTKKTVSKKTKTHDIDIAIIVDDTDVRRLTRSQLKDKLFKRLMEMSKPISKKLHPQPYLLTEFWQYVMDGNPVLYNVLRDGILIFDTGFFLPMQMLMKMGNIKPSKECIDKHIYIADELVKMVDRTMLTKLTYDLEQSVVSSAQAVLMELGYRPPAPNEIAGFVKKVLVDENKLVDKKYSAMAKNVIKTYKDIEHKDKKKISGEELQKLKEDATIFVKAMKKILKDLREEKGESFLYESVEKKKKKNSKVKRPTDVDITRDNPQAKSEKLHEELGNR